MRYVSPEAQIHMDGIWLMNGGESCYVSVKKVVHQNTTKTFVSHTHGIMNDVHHVQSEQSRCAAVPLQSKIVAVCLCLFLYSYVFVTHRHSFTPIYLSQLPFARIESCEPSARFLLCIFLGVLELLT